MDYTTLGRRSGLRVSQVSLGAGNFGTAWGSGAEPHQAQEILDRFAEAGGNFIDVADMYQAGESENIVGDWLRRERDRFVLATKYTYGAEAGRPVALVGNSRKNMVTSLEASLRRLGTDYVDVLWVHNDDAITPMEEIVRTFDDLIGAGKILHAGLSNFPAWRTAHAVDLADAHGWSPVAAVQIEYSLAERSADRELIPMAEAFGLGITTYSPLGGGLLTGKYRTSDEGRLTTWGSVILQEDNVQRSAVLDLVLHLADQLGATPSEVATAWVVHRAQRSPVPWIPILGPRTLDQLDSYLAAIDLRLPEEAWTALDEVSNPPLGAPHDIRKLNEVALAGGPGVCLLGPRAPVR